MTTLMNLAHSAAHAASSADAASGGWISAFTDWIVQIMEGLGLTAVFLLLALETVIPFIPSEMILPLAGFTASQGNSFGIVAAIIVSTLGSTLGAVVLYALAALFGRERTRAWMAKIPLFDVNDIDKTEAFFDKHSKSTVFFGRMLPIFRSLISLPAGVIRMPMAQFLLYTGAGSLIWNVVLVTAGYVLGENWHIVEEYSSVFSKIFAVLCVLVVLVWIAVRIVRNCKNRHDSKEKSLS